MPTFFPAAQQQAGTTRQLLREPDGSLVRRTVLPNGLRVISESVPGVRAATLGVWSGVGSRDETPRSAGAAHFLEHLLFKGTTGRSAMDIAAEVDAVGGQMNAFTTKEYTCFYAKVLGTDLPVAVDVMLDITTRATLRPGDIDSERSVVLEEIGLHEDDAADLAGEAVETAVLGRSPLSRPVLGSRESISGMATATVRSFFRRHYRPGALAVAVSGNVDHQALVRLVRAAVEPMDWPWGVAPAPVRVTVGRHARRTVSGGLRLRPWHGDQCAVEWGVRGIARTHPDRQALDVLNTLLGGGMSSRLFQSIREERGLVYSVYSGHSAFSDTGVWSVSAGCHAQNVSEVLSVIATELHTLRRDGAGADEVARAKGHLSGSAVLAAEETGARMSALGRAEVVTGELVGIDELLDRIDRVTLADVDRVARELLAQAPHVAVVGVPDTGRNRADLAGVIGAAG